MAASRAAPRSVPPGVTEPGCSRSQRVEHGTEVFRQRAAKHATPGKRHDGRSVGRISTQRSDQALGHLDRHGQAIRDRVLGRHAPADVDHEHEVVARRKCRARAGVPTAAGRAR